MTGWQIIGALLMRLSALLIGTAIVYGLCFILQLVPEWQDFAVAYAVLYLLNPVSLVSVQK